MSSAATGAATRRSLLASMRTLYDRFAHLVHELGRFGTVGAICYVVDVGTFNICLLGWGLSWFPSLVISTAIAATLAFLGNRFWTWRHRERTALHREYARYVGFNIIGLLISAAILWLSHDVVGTALPAFQTPMADNISGKIVGVGVASAFRFWAYRRYVFRPTRPGHVPR